VASTSLAASGKKYKPSNRSQAATGSHLPALTNATSRSSSSSVLSKGIKISQNIKVKAEPHRDDASIEIIEHGLEDNDETVGVEREAALKSPPKGKTRVSSAVSEIFYCIRCLLTYQKKNCAGSC
jgi:hypothetical protein